MARRIEGGQIIAQLVLEVNKWVDGVKSAGTHLGTMVTRFRDGFNNINAGIAKFGSSDQLAEKMGFLAGAIFGPIALAMTTFANQNEVARNKVKELTEQLNGMSDFDKNFTRQGQAIQQQLVHYQNLARETSVAAAQQKRIADAFTSLRNEIGKLLFEVLNPYINKIIEYVRNGIEWIKVNRETAGSVILLAAQFGGLMVALFPVVAVIGKLAGLLSLLLSGIGFLMTSIGLLTLVFGGLVLLFSNDLLPIWEEFGKKATQILTDVLKGTITYEEAIKQLAVALGETLVSSFIKFGENLNAFFDGLFPRFSRNIEEFFLNLIQFPENLMKAIDSSFIYLRRKFDDFLAFLRNIGSQILNIPVIGDMLRGVGDFAFSLGGPSLAQMQAMLVPAGVTNNFNIGADPFFQNDLKAAIDRASERSQTRLAEDMR